MRSILIKGYQSLPDTVLHCPQRFNESSPQPLLARQVNPQHQTVDSSGLVEAWKRLVEQAQTWKDDALTDERLYQHLYQANDSQIAEALSELQVVQPEPGLKLSVADALDWLTFQYLNRQRFPECLYAVGFKRFWRPTLHRFIQGSELIHVGTLEDVPDGATAVIWGRQPAQSRVRLIQLEDGFLRSVGLGAEFVQPLSWVCDTRTLYFDATAASDLEVRLNDLTLTPEQADEARQLRQRIIERQISKYNTGSAFWQFPVTEKPVVLVIGQVEDDASIRFGAGPDSSNLKLLQTVRNERPDACIVYKPHPDVVAGARAQGNDEHKAFEIADEVVTNANISQMLETDIEQVHVLTSLAGFEALLRGVKVVCHGMPFYAGWGLTEDRVSIQRRTAVLSIETLIYGTLISYPLYVSRFSGYYTTANHTLDTLSEWKAKGEGNTRFLRRVLRKFLNQIRRLR